MKEEQYEAVLRAFGVTDTDFAMLEYIETPEKLAGRIMKRNEAKNEVQKEVESFFADSQFLINNDTTEHPAARLVAIEKIQSAFDSYSVDENKILKDKNGKVTSKSVSQVLTDLAGQAGFKVAKKIELKAVQTAASNLTGRAKEMQERAMKQKRS